jgi:hypothetical protein
VDDLLLVVVGVVAALAGLVWLTGQVAGRLASGRWPRVPVAELPGILARLPRHLGDPGGAWPATVRAALPGAGGMYATLALLAVPAVLIAFGLWSALRPQSPEVPAP